MQAEPPSLTRPSFFETKGCSEEGVLELVGFNASDYIEGKGLRSLDRNTKIAMAATSLALGKSGLSEEQRRKVGMVLGTMFGSMTSISDFNLESIQNGPLSVSPMLFPNTVINSPTSQVNIRFGLSGLSATLSSCNTSSLDALGYACQMIQTGMADALLAGGSEELCSLSYHALDRFKLLGTAEEDHPPPAEGAAILLLEEFDHAVRRGSPILAEIRGQANTFAPDQKTDSQNALQRSIEASLAEAGLHAQDINQFFSSVSGFPWQRRLTSALVARLLPNAKTMRKDLQRYLGESFGALGSLTLAAALGPLNDQVSNANGPEHILLGGVGYFGNASALVLTRSQTWGEA
ncbi:MAG: hypothetical protein A2527_00970 [Candidatus Lambdaproteobacteria bacterium RIFOXYD2_FULL_50_16]|uniref:Ketosynthase family 3 (KS3) domain-containing protein n=1 Tax=Candidatus Lambdaproteobacteria bacterium RIFOXYD2_FULL_50_16 TaxID=1817772 RepID=A0A1F6G9I7_9PROT|nr:MAG: hypothetical protein A2527_00970 [Candidatus Lambdaproteobacteria bacterium RIFOXYD2_FULL_50_16]